MGLPKFGHMYRLTREPELTFSQNQVAICKVGLACSEKYNDKETQLFLDATAFKKTAEMLATVQKGHRVFVVGKIQTESWTDNNSGQKRSKTVMIVESFEFVEPKQQQAPQNHQQPQQTGGYSQQSQSGGYQQQGYQQQNSNNHQHPQQGQPDDSIPFRHNEV